MSPCPPKVSVIVPNYNHGRYLRRRLESILGQSFRDFELIILDDCSTDDSRDVIADYLADPRVVTLFNAHNSGSTFKQWDKGLRIARGEYVWFAESDDYAEPTLVETLVDRMERHPNVGLAMTQSWVVDESGIVLHNYLIDQRKLYEDASHWETDYLNKGATERSAYFYRSNPIPNASAVLFRRRTLKQIGPLPTHMKLCGDWMIYARVLRHSDIAFVARPLNYFRAHSSSVREKANKTEIAWSETFLVRRELARGLRLTHEKVWDDEVRAFVFIALGTARRPPHQKVPLRDLPGLLARLASAGWRGLGMAIPVLAREQAADLARRLHLLPLFGSHKSRA